MYVIRLRKLLFHDTVRCDIIYDIKGVWIQMKSQNYTLRKATGSDYEFIYQVKKEAYKSYVEINFGNWNEAQQREYFQDFIEACKEECIQRNSSSIF